MPYLLGFHAIHFWNPWGTLINPVWILLMMFKIVFKIASALCTFYSNACFLTALFIFPCRKVIKMIENSLCQPLFKNWGRVHETSSKWILKPIFSFHDWFWDFDNAALWFCGFCVILIPIYAGYLAIYLAIQASIGK